MKKLRSMNAWADEENLISYETATAWRRGEWLIIRDYPTITSKKHLRAWLDEYFSYSLRKSIHMSLEWAICNALGYARSNGHEYIIVHTYEDGYHGWDTFKDREEMVADCWYSAILDEYTPTI